MNRLSGGENQKDEEKMKRCDLPFATLYFKQRSMILEMAEGENTDHAKALLCLKKAREHFSDKPYGIIDNRKHSFSVDPSAFGNIRIDKNLKAVAIVADRPATVKTVRDVELPIAETFTDVPLKVFPDLEAAEAWIASRLTANRRC